MKQRSVIVLGALLALLTLFALVRSSPSIGFPRDEAVYFEASRRHGAWFASLAREPAKALSQKSRDRHFRFNNEHPPLMKSLAGVSARLLARPPAAIEGQAPHAFAARGGVLPVMSESAAMRLPAQALAALAVFLLFVAGASGARARPGATPHRVLGAGLLAAGAFILLPRVAFHASLHCFDLPIAVALLAVVLAYQKGRSSLRWSLITAVALGLAISIKHNALFVGPLLAVHHYASLWMQRRQGRSIPKAAWLPPVLVLPALIAPVVLWLSWPWLWSQPVDRLLAYFEFHARHSYYNMEFLGANYNRPPLPIAYPFVMTWATVPTTLLLLAGCGFLFATAKDVAPEPPAEAAAPRFPRLRAGLLPHDAPSHERLLLAIFILFPLLLIALPTVPIFGGTKHWLTAYPFMALAAARGWIGLWERVDLGPEAVRRVGPVAALAVVLLPAGWATVHGHPYNLSQYAPAAGGARGAARLGLNRGFWGYAAPALMEAHAEGSQRVYLHDVHALAQLQYAREGRWPAGWKVNAPGRADAGFIFHERHMLSDELGMWRGDQVGAPRDQICLDDVPLTSWYGE